MTSTSAPAPTPPTTGRPSSRPTGSPTTTCRQQVRAGRNHRAERDRCPSGDDRRPAAPQGRRATDRRSGGSRQLPLLTAPSCHGGAPGRGGGAASMVVVTWTREGRLGTEPKPKRTGG